MARRRNQKILPPGISWVRLRRGEKFFQCYRSFLQQEKSSEARNRRAVSALSKLRPEVREGLNETLSRLDAQELVWKLLDALRFRSGRRRYFIASNKVRWIKMSERDRRIAKRCFKLVILRYGLGGEDVHTLRRVGEIIGISLERARQVEAKVLRTMGTLLLQMGLYVGPDGDLHKKRWWTEDSVLEREPELPPLKGKWKLCLQGLTREQGEFWKQLHSEVVSNGKTNQVAENGSRKL